MAQRARSRTKRSLLALGGALLAVSCAPAKPPEPRAPSVPPVDTARVQDTVPLMVRTDTAVPQVPTRPLTLKPWAEATLEGLSLRRKVAQMVMPFIFGDFAPEGTSGEERAMGFVRDGIGGVILSVGSPTEVAAKLNVLQRASDIPMLVGADLETGAGFRFHGILHTPTNIDLGGATDFPSLMALGAAGEPRLAYQMGRVTALEARAIGIHVPFAPVLDVNNNPANPIINVRSFGEDPASVAELGVEFVRGVQDNGAIATGKHFPGHGDTGTDSHLALPTITGSRARMDSVELRPFQAAIDAGMGAVMTAHITVPSLNGGDGTPATLSAAVLTKLLRDEMDFGGLLFTDAMDMSAISGRLGTGEAAAQAVLAGADVLLMPPNVTQAIDGVVEAVESGRISMARIDDAVLRLLRAKESLGLDTLRTVDLENVHRVVGIPEHTGWAREAAERSITVLRNESDLLPLRGTRSARVLSVTYRRSNDLLAGRYFNSRLRGTYPRLNTVELTRNDGGGIWDGVLRQARTSALVVVGTYVTAVSYSGSLALPTDVSDFIKALGSANIPHIVISFGNPYLLGDFPNVQSYMLAWSGSEVSQRAAADALFANFAISGRSPIGAPGMFDIGDGIRIPARTPVGGGEP